MPKSNCSPPEVNRPVATGTRGEPDTRELLETLLLCEDVFSDFARLDDGTPSVSALIAVRKLIAKLQHEGGADDLTP